MPGSTLDHGNDASRLGTVASVGRSVPARAPADRSVRAAPSAATYRARRARRPGHRQRVARDRRAARMSSRSPTAGTSRRSTARCTTSRARYPFDARARGLPRAHHDRHARRADLPVPADRVAPLPGAAAADVAAAERRTGERPGRSRSSISICRSTTASRRASRASSASGLSFLKSGIETRSAAFNRLIERIEQVAIALARADPADGSDRRRQVPARAAHLRAEEGAPSGAAATFVEVNCATLRGDAAMSALFGHGKGAFTGARAGSRRACCARPTAACCSSTRSASSALDEQAMLLRAIEEKTFLPLGADREVRERIPAHRRHEPRSAGGDASAGGSARICSRASTSGRSGCRGSRERPEDIEPNLDYELARIRAHATAAQVTFNREARERFLDFAARPARAGPATSATSTPPSSAWRRSRTAGASRSTSSTKRSSGCTARGAAAATASNRWSTRLLGPETRAPSSIASIACSSKTCCACAARVTTLSDAGRLLFSVSRAGEAHEQRCRSAAQISRALRPGVAAGTRDARA